MAEIRSDFPGLIIGSARIRICNYKFGAALCNKVAVAIRRQSRPERTRMMTSPNEVIDKPDLDFTPGTVEHDQIVHDQV